MSTETHEAPTPKTVVVNLTYEAIALLKQVLATHWSEDLAQMYRVGSFLEGCINDSNPGEPKLDLGITEDRPLTSAERQAVDDHNKAYKSWASTTTALSVPQKVFGDIQECMRHYAKKKAMAPKPAVMCIIAEFELVKE